MDRIFFVRSILNDFNYYENHILPLKNNEDEKLVLMVLSAFEVYYTEKYKEQEHAVNGKQ